MATQNAIGSAKPIEVAFGGTGVATLTDHGVTVGAGTGAVTSLAVGTDAQILIGNSGADPSWSGAPIVNSIEAANFYTSDAADGLTISSASIVADGTETDINISITAKGAGHVIIDDLELGVALPVAEGGTGTVSHTDHGVLLGNDTAAVSSTAEGATGEVLIGTTGAAASWSDSPVVDSMSSQTFYTTDTADGLTISSATILADGTETDIDLNITAKGAGQVVISDLYLSTALTVPFGGTGASNFTDNGVIYGNGTAALGATAELSNGQLLVGSTGNAPVAAAITSTGGTIAFTTGAGTLNLESTVIGISWSEITNATKTIVVNEGYVANRGTLITFTLPAAATVGQTFTVTGKGAGGWKIEQNASQTIYLGTGATTTGTGGSLASTEDRDTVTIVCVTEDEDFNVLNSIGNITVV